MKCWKVSHMPQPLSIQLKLCRDLCESSVQPGWRRLCSLLSLFKEKKTGRKTHVASPKTLYSLKLKRRSSEVPPILQCLYVLGANDLN